MEQFRFFKRCAIKVIHGNCLYHNRETLWRLNVNNLVHLFLKVFRCILFPMSLYCVNFNLLCYFKSDFIKSPSFRRLFRCKVKTGLLFRAMSHLKTFCMHNLLMILMIENVFLYTDLWRSDFLIETGYEGRNILRCITEIIWLSTWHSHPWKHEKALRNSVIRVQKYMYTQNIALICNCWTRPSINLLS